ncbi:MAG TPA: SDR family oxidoreductase [Acidimicrobiales bacterium]|nr:SDR family oxidoreductase [Acidimicrobiales bacterium]
MEGRVCIVSGVGPGLGREIALLLASEGADVVLGARTESVLRDVAAEVEVAGRRAEVVPTDVTDVAQCARLAAHAVDAFGRVDVLVNNAYVPDVFKTFEKVDLDDWRRIVEVNLFGPLQLTKAVVPHMRAQGGGSIVFVNSMIVRKPIALQGGYAVSKGALLTAAQVLAQELGRHHIRVNSVLPGWMWGPQVELYVQFTAQRRGISEQEVVDEIASAIPLGTVPTDDEVAHAVAFFASDRSSAITGQALDVNGGEVFA